MGDHTIVAPCTKAISCCYHGWHYGVDGTILDTPNDPASRVREKLRHTAYPVHDYKGIIFAYMGPPDTVPQFPAWTLWRTPKPN